MTKYQAVTKIEPEFLRIVATGEYFYSDMAGFIAFVKAESDRTGILRVLIDCQDLKGDMTEGERFEGGVLVAQTFGPKIRAALLLPAQTITKLGELAAVNRGAQLLVTSSEPEATSWLLEK